MNVTIFESYGKPPETESGAARGHPTLKEQMLADIDDVFFCLEEFEEKHKIDGKEMGIVMDENELLERSAHWEGGAKQSFDTGLYKSMRLFYVRKEDYGPRPRVGKPLDLDGVSYQVADCTEEHGVYAMTIERVRQ